VFDLTDNHQGRFAGYGPSEPPSPLDDEVAQFVAKVAGAGPTGVSDAVEVATENGRRVLRAYAERMASIAVRRSDIELGRSAVIALVIGGLNDGTPEALTVMAPLEAGVRKLGGDPGEVFGRAAEVVGHPGSVSLMLWLARTPADRTLSSMGFVEGEDDSGFGYRLDW
jgi:hypothetical protein